MTALAHAVLLASLSYESPLPASELAGFQASAGVQTADAFSLEPNKNGFNRKDALVSDSTCLTF